MKNRGGGGGGGSEREIETGRRYHVLYIVGGREGMNNCL